MNQVVCPSCDSQNIAAEKRPSGWFHCQDCHYFWPIRFGFDAPPRKQTVFNHITQSPEVLAEKLIYWEHDEVDGWWVSNILDGKFDTKEEAIAATVARLKELVEVETTAN